jgi:hypothetical protein
MFCKNCGSQLEDNARFCPNCGSAQEVNVYAQPNYVNAVPAQKGASFGISVSFFFALAALAYKVVCHVMNMDGIYSWWTNGSIFVYYSLWLTSFLTIAASLIRGLASLVISIVMIIVSAFMLMIDGIMFLGFAASLYSTRLVEVGIMPVVNILNILVSIGVIIEYSVRRSKSRS